MSNSNQNKKERERKILFQIYDKDTLDEPIESERPDFQVRRKGSNSSFGVEIVENYSSESIARLENIKGYGPNLLEGKPHRHKDDKAVLIVDKVDLLDKDNNLKQKDITAIIYKEPSLIECAASVAEKIADKGKAYLSLPESLSHVNLIILDKSQSFLKFTFDQFYWLYFKSHLWHQICRTPFRQVYYVASFDKTWKSCRLNTVLVVSELFLLNHWLKTTNINSFQSINHMGAYFASYLQTVVSGTVHHMPHERGHEIIYGDTGVLIKDDMSVAIRLYDDTPIPSEAVIFDRTINGLFQSSMTDSVNECRDKSTFKSDLLFPTNYPDDHDL